MRFVIVILFLLVQSRARAQYAEVGHDVAPTQQQQQAISLAVGYLEAQGWDFSEISVSSAELQGDYPAASVPGHIGIDFERVAEVIPPDTPGAPFHPGLLVVLIMHELYHLEGGYGTGLCDELEIASKVAKFYHCDLICAVAAVGGATDALCMMFEHIRSKVNHPETMMEALLLGCPGLAGSMQPCSCCG